MFSSGNFDLLDCFRCIDSTPYFTTLFPMYRLDSCPISECAYITLLEKEFESYPTDDNKEELPTSPQLFTVVHVCEALAKHDDSGSRLLKKIRGKASSNGSLEIPVLLHEGNILREKRLGSNNNNYEAAGSLLLPEYIDAAIGTRNSLRPDDSVTLYNMNLVS